MLINQVILYHELACDYDPTRREEMMRRSPMLMSYGRAPSSGRSISQTELNKRTYQLFGRGTLVTRPPINLDTLRKRPLSKSQVSLSNLEINVCEKR